MNERFDSLPLVSVITVVRNGERFIENTIKSVINQTYPAIEYIIIDGSSKDGTIGIIKKYENRISRWISEPDKSLFDAMNKALRMAKGTYVWFVHAGDEIYAKDTLEKTFAEKKDCDVYYGDTILIDMNRNELGFFRGHNSPKQLTWRSMNKGTVISHQSFIVRKDLAPEYLYEEYTISADTDWLIACLKRSEKIVNTNQIMCRFLIGGISAKNEFKSWVENYHIFKKHYGFGRNLINHLFLGTNLIVYKIFGKRFLIN